jgi:hypothetical protein
VSWAAPAIALVVAWLTNRKRWDERALVNVASVTKESYGGIRVRLSNDGGRPALDVRVEVGTICSGSDGVRHGKEVDLLFRDQPDEDFAFTLSFLDVDGRRYAESRRVVFVCGKPSLVPRAVDHVIKVRRCAHRERSATLLNQVEERSDADRETQAASSAPG